MKTWVIAGTGKAGPADMQWAVWAYEAPNKDYVVVLVAGDLKANLPALEAIQKSVKPAPASTEVKPEGKASPEAKEGGDKPAPEAKEGDDKTAPEAKEGEDAKEGDDAKDDAKEAGDKGGDAKEDAKEEGGK